MLFLVISEPRPERPSEVARTRQSFWPWIAEYRSKGVCKDVYARVGRGAAAIFDVRDHLELHRILNQWADIIPAEFAVYPLLDASEATGHLAAQTGTS
jgi:hypothetical protein